MANSHLRLSKTAIGIVGALLSLIAIVYYCWPLPNALARSRVRSILHAGSTPQQLKQLEPFVKVGDHISGVYNRLSPTPDSQSKTRRPTEWALSLGDAHLILAFQADGRIIGIGRHLKGIDDGTVWLSAAPW
jgi:hypothetical protein